MTNSILVPLDSSPASEEALPLALAIAHATGETVEFVHVHELAPLFGEPAALDTALDVDEARHRREPIEALAERLTRAHGVPVSTTLLSAMQPAEMAAVMPAHQDLASRMMDAMAADMQGRKMQPDPRWTVLGDSLRSDLTAMHELSREGLKVRMQAHVARMQRMMVMHEGMMHM